MKEPGSACPIYCARAGIALLRFLRRSCLVTGLILGLAGSLQADALQNEPASFEFKPRYMRYSLNQEFAPPGSGSNVLKSAGYVELQLEIFAPKEARLLACRGGRIKQVETIDGEQLKPRRAASTYVRDWEKPAAQERKMPVDVSVSFAMPPKFVNSSVNIKGEADLLYGLGLPEVLVIEPVADFLDKRVTQPSVEGLVIVISQINDPKSREQQFQLQVTARLEQHLWGITFHDASGRQLAHDRRGVPSRQENQELSKHVFRVEGAPVTSIRLEMFPRITTRTVGFSLQNVDIYPALLVKKPSTPKPVVQTPARNEDGRVILRSVPTPPQPESQEVPQDKPLPQLEVEVQGND